MGYLYMFIATLLWSLVGTMVKTASVMFPSSVITLGRFFFGFIFLGLFMAVKKRKLVLYWKNKWIWIGVLSKSCNYIFENIAIGIGFAYSNVVIWPVQAVFLTLMAVFLFKEKMTPVKVVAMIFCIIGVLFVSWKGMPLSELLGDNLLILILFILAAIGAGVHATSLKKLIGQMDSGNINFTVFLLSSFVTVIPVPFTARFPGGFSWLAILSLVGLGLVTGISFYLNAEALKKISFLTAGIINNTSVLFTLLWSKLFFNESVNGYVITGVVILLAGLVLISLPQKKAAAVVDG